MISTATSITLGIHVLSGIVALVAGFTAIITAKGGRRHRSAGKYYAASMGVVVLTAIPLAVIVESWFLLAIAVFTGYLLFAGIRVISRRRSGATQLELIDTVGHGAMIVAGSGMVLAGVSDTVFGVTGLGPVLVVFGGVGVGLAVRELHTLSKPVAEQVPWFNRHIGFMGGAYIATVTAAITVNLTMLPPLVRWLTPTLIGVPCIIYATRKYGSRFGRPSRPVITGPTPFSTEKYDGD